MATYQNRTQSQDEILQNSNQNIKGGNCLSLEQAREEDARQKTSVWIWL